MVTTCSTKLLYSNESKGSTYIQGYLSGNVITILVVWRRHCVPFHHHHRWYNHNLDRPQPLLLTKSRPTAKHDADRSTPHSPCTPAGLCYSLQYMEKYFIILIKI